jgi:NAD(P)-dependent dehydrogenase (short-subunit alcohol dehydrogenase family)
MPYSVTKAAGEGVVPELEIIADGPHEGLHLMKALAMTQGPKIRVNAILPGFLKTEWARTQYILNDLQVTIARVYNFLQSK